jgi:hypothetical protein
LTDSIEKVIYGAHAHFLKTPMRLTPLDARDRVKLGKIVQRSCQTCGEGLYCQSSARADLSKIFAVALLSTFSTQSAINGSGW